MWGGKLVAQRPYFEPQTSLFSPIKLCVYLVTCQHFVFKIFLIKTWPGSLGFSSHGNKSASTEEQLSFIQGHTLQVTRVLLPSDPLLSLFIYVASRSIWDCHPSTSYILIPSVIVYY